MSWEVMTPCIHACVVEIYRVVDVMGGEVMTIDFARDLNHRVLMYHQVDCLREAQGLLALNPNP